MKFKENLRHLRRSVGMSQNELAERLGYRSFTTVQKWEDGTSFPKVENLNRLSEIFGVELDHLLNSDLSAAKAAVPILGEVKAGYDMYANEEVLGYEYVDSSEYENGEFFYLVVKGDSMKGDRIEEGDHLYIRRQNYLDNNDLGVFLIDGEEVTVKRIIYSDDGIILRASNPAYPDRHFEERDVRILGKVLHNRVNLK